MAHGAGLGLTITRLTRLIRQRRALFYGVRGLVWGLCLAIIAGGAPSDDWAVGPAPGGWLWEPAGALLGVLYGVLLRVPPVDALGLADRAFDLKDRLATAHDLLARADREWAGRRGDRGRRDARRPDHARTGRAVAVAPRAEAPPGAGAGAGRPAVPAADPGPRRLDAVLHARGGGGEEARGRRSPAGHRAPRSEEDREGRAGGDAGPRLPDAPQPGEPRAHQG